MDNHTTIEKGAGQGGLRLRVMGVGRAGLNVLSRLVTTGFPAADLVAFDTDTQSLDSCPVTQKVLLEARGLRGLGSGGDSQRARAAAEECMSVLHPHCEGADVVFIVTGLGGGTGTGVSPLLAKQARQAGALVLGFSFLPFDCEGPTLRDQAGRGLEELKEAADGVVCLPNEDIFRLIGDAASVRETIIRTNDLLAEGMRGMWRLITRRGLLEISFEDLCSVLRNRHSESCFAVAEGSGAERVAKALEDLMAHPALDEGRVLSHADAVLVSLMGGPEMSMVEVKQVMARIEEACGRARVTMGARVADDFQGRLSVTVIAASPARRRPTQTPSEPPVPEESHADSEEGQDLFPRFPAQGATLRGRAPHALPPNRLTPAPSSVPGRVRRESTRMRQGQLPLESVSRGRFEKGEPTILHGEDLDVPTYVRRGICLN